MSGEVHICQFPFTSGAAGKIRPVLVLFDLRADAVICRSTSAEPTDPLDIVLSDWQHAGLLKPAVARLDRLVTAARSIFLRRLGSLSAADAATIRAAWNRHMRL